jgi:hypothetical protein
MTWTPENKNMSVWTSITVHISTWTSSIKSKSSFLLQENGFHLLQENGFKIILDQSAGETPNWIAENKS